VPDTGSVLSYAELEERVQTLACRLAAIGVRRGDVVALVLPDGLQLIQLLLAITTLGAGAAPLNPGYTEHEHRQALVDVSPRLLLLPAGELAPARSAAGNAPIVDVIAKDEEPVALAVGGVNVTPVTEVEPGDAEDVALLLHTSGTTSRPKLVPLLQRNLMASSRTVAEHYGLGPDDVSYCLMPLFHIHGLVAPTFATLVSGGTVIIPRRMGPRRFWCQARENGVTWFSAAPTLHEMILGKIDKEGPPKTLRFVRSSSSALTPALMRRAESAYGAPMLEAYGMTEASHQIASNPLPPAARVTGSVGIATGTEIAIVDRDYTFLEEGTYGEVVIRGPGVATHYRGNPEANSDSFFDGWFRTGDRGAIEDGYVRLDGRLKEMILRGGENISPAEIENVLLLHPAVSDAACFGVEDEKYGETVAAAVSLSGQANEATLTAHCRRRLAAFKVPSVIYVLDVIPRTPTGKLQRRRVAASITEHERAR
jgi:acyl-CoA synthetase (AMP-forming)/AMP-acid ligase II